MKHRRTRPFEYVSERTRSVQAVRAWRKLLPDWMPTLDMLRGLDHRSTEHQSAVRAVTYGWPPNDARWDVLLALLENERREERQRWGITENEITTETPLPSCPCGSCADVGCDVCPCHRTEAHVHPDVPTMNITTLKGEPGEDRRPEVREGHVAGSEDWQVQGLREVHPQGTAVLADREPVQQEPRDGTSQDVPHDREGSARSRPSVVRTAPGVYQVRTLWGAGLYRGER